MNSEIKPLETLFDDSRGDQLPLPAILNDLYGPLRFPLQPERPYILCNFVSTLDGVVSLNEPGHAGAGEIGGFNRHDQMVMGILRAAGDVVIAGASELRAPPGHIWTAEAIYPPLIPQFQQLRANLGKPPAPLNVIITGLGKIDLSLPLFQSGEVPVLILTTLVGAGQMLQYPLPSSVKILALKSSGGLTAPEILKAIGTIMPASLILIEGGPHIAGNFLDHRLLDELFLTIAPQVAGRPQAAGRPHAAGRPQAAGREPTLERPGFAAGVRFAPENPLWSELIGVKRGGDFLFTRYLFKRSIGNQENG